MHNSMSRGIVLSVLGVGLLLSGCAWQGDAVATANQALTVAQGAQATANQASSTATGAAQAAQQAQQTAVSAQQSADQARSLATQPAAYSRRPRG
jgi:hypothetical protein